MKKILITLLSLLFLNAYAEELVEFKNGEVADANKVNSNFSELEKRIDSLKNLNASPVITNSNTYHEVVVSASSNCLGLNGGSYLENTFAENGATYELSIVKNSAKFNNDADAVIASIGVQYISPNRKMEIASIHSNKKTYITTEQEYLRFFVVDICDSNSGEITVAVKKVNF